MALTAVKVAVSALVVALVASISRYRPDLGGWIAALPIISLLSAAWLMVGHASSEHIYQFFLGVLKGIIPTAVLLAAVVVLMRRGWPFPGALGLALVAWGVSSFCLGKVWHG
ncbi:hypothetical protein GCM10025857_12890 [Alicyclobacillus contaminans]|uniref:DUF3147 family protein n=1 Tax=Alicyclobacillus contaminans TaxID=392016 RepID=UPI00042A83E1|nr:DUF3147 family protein [Alicyclobacillus contaminans]GMA49932.1 hypothetical protein GCM10025857_12890 [Alicyclobacillus contaminans]